jgi:twitching motility protein PilT
LHRHNKSIVSQRELGADTKSYPNALRSALREDPNVILIGELRDTETIHTALMAAETGHLVLAAVHTQNATQTLDRIIDVFAESQQQQVRVMLSNGLAAILSQTLLPRKTPKQGASATTRGRIAAMEVMLNTPAIANLIREGKISQIYSAIQMGGQQGMQTLETALAQLVKSGAVDYEAALLKAVRPDDFNRLVGPHAMAPAGRSSGTL